MAQWFKNRLEIIRLILQRPTLLLAFGILQIVDLLLRQLPASLAENPLVGWVTGIPWYGWAMGWLGILWISALNFLVERKKIFDETSSNFFTAYLDFLLHEAHNLFSYSERPDFYQKVKDWQHQAVLGIAIGLGAEESEKFFQRMESQNPVMEAYRKSQEVKNNEPLCRALQAHIDELTGMRLTLTEAKAGEKRGLAVLKRREGSPAGPIPGQKLLGGAPSAPNSPKTEPLKIEGPSRPNPRGPF